MPLAGLWFSQFFYTVTGFLKEGSLAMTSATRFLFSASALCVFLSVGYVPTAQAGFEWVPNQAASGSATPELPAISPDRVDILDLGPLMVDAPVADVSPVETQGMAPRRVRPPMPDHASALDMPPPSAPQPVMTAQSPAVQSAAQAMPVAQNAAMPETLGFGNDIPLVLALRQIVPAEYGFSFADGVDQGARVSWNGGQPWDMVLNNALAPLGFGAVIAGRAVRIVPAAEMPVQNHPHQQHAEAAPLPEQEISLMTAPVEADAPPQEIYIRRDRDDRRGFWSRLGFSTDDSGTGRREYVVRTPEPEPLPQTQGTVIAPLAADTTHAAGPVSLTEGLEDHPAAVGGFHALRYWHAERGDSLKNVLQGWSDDAGVVLHWVAVSDYPLPAAIRVEGNFTDAITKVLSSYDESGPRPVGRLHPNLPHGPAALVVEPSSVAHGS